MNMNPTIRIEDIMQCVRPHLRGLQPYSSARDEFSGQAHIYLDANENPFGSPLLSVSVYNRYPDPHQQSLKERLAKLKGVAPGQIFLGNGSDEAIDLLIRAFCEPAQDRILITPPTYGMYEVSAAIHNVGVLKVPLLPEVFQLNTDEIIAQSRQAKLIWLCSPNNPTGNLLRREDIHAILTQVHCPVVIDEAYIDFSEDEGWLPHLEHYPNLIVLQTFSKAWGLAGLRLGVAYAHPQIIHLLDKIKPPYNINAYTQKMALQALDQRRQVALWIENTRRERQALSQALTSLPFVEKVFPSDANFILVRMQQASAIYRYLITCGIIVRDRSRVVLCDNCLRITVGKPEENRQLLNALREWQKNG